MRYFVNPYSNDDHHAPSDINDKIDDFIQKKVQPMLFESDVTAANSKRDSIYKGNLGRAFILLFSPRFKGWLPFIRHSHFHDCM